MGFFTYVGKNKWFRYTILSLLGVAFIFAQAGTGIIQYFTSSGMKVHDMVVISEKKVSRQEYHRMFSIIKQELIQEGYATSQVNRLAHFCASEHFLLKHRDSRLHRSLGLEVLPEEELAIFEEARDLAFLCYAPRVYVADMLQFQDKKGRFDKRKWIAMMREMASTREGKERIKSIEEVVKPRRLKQKLSTVIEATVHVSKLEASQYPSDEKVRISCLSVPYTSGIEVEEISKEEKQKYLEEHASKYENEEARHYAYVLIPIVPSQEDEDLFKEEVKALALQFEQSTSAESFAKRYTDSKKKTVFRWKKAKMPPLLATQLRSLRKGKVIGPFRNGNMYTLYKMISYDGSHKVYKVAKLVKKVKVSEYTAHECLKEIESFKKVKSLKDFEAKAKGKGLETHTLSETRLSLNRTLGYHNTRRTIQRWLFHPETKVNSVSGPIEDKDNRYIVCIMTGETKKGRRSLKEARSEVEAGIRKERASRRVEDRLVLLLDKYGSLKDIARAYGKEAKVRIFEIANFEQNNLGTIGSAPKVIGSAFGLKIGQRSGVIVDGDRIFIIKRLPSTDKEFTQKMLLSKRRQGLYDEQRKEVFSEVKNKGFEEANIEDNRHIDF